MLSHVPDDCIPLAGHQIKLRAFGLSGNHVEAVCLRALDTWLRGLSTQTKAAGFKDMGLEFYVHLQIRSNFWFEYAVHVL